MNLTLNTQWAQRRNRTYLVVTVSAPQEPAEATASEIYLDIQMPKGVRIRSIGSLPSNGHRNNIGIDLPNLATGNTHNIVFKVKSRDEFEGDVTPELHLHWRDAQSGDLLERHQVGTALPTELPGIEADLAEIIEEKTRENHSMNSDNKNPNTTNRTERREFGRRPRHGHDPEFREGMDVSERRSRRGGRADFAAEGREFGRRARRGWNSEFHAEGGEIERRPRRGGHRHQACKNERSGRAGFETGREMRRHWEGMRAERRHNRRHGIIRTVQDLQEQVLMLENRFRRMQRKARMRAMRNGEQIVERTTTREIVRTPRGGRGGYIPTTTHRGRRMHGEGRKMGRMARHAFAHRDDRW